LPTYLLRQEVYGDEMRDAYNRISRNWEKVDETVAREEEIGRCVWCGCICSECECVDWGCLDCGCGTIEETGEDEEWTVDESELEEE